MASLPNLNDLKVGQRITLTGMPGDPDPIPAGTQGTVTRILPFGDGTFQITVEWDVARSLALVSPPDTFTVEDE